MQTFVHHSGPGFSEPSCVSMVFWGIHFQFIFGSLQLDYCGAASHCVELFTLCTYLAARLCNISGLWMFCLVVGSQMIEAYSSVGLTNVQYDLTGLGHLLVLCLRKIRVLLAFFVTASIWWFQGRLLFIFMPRCFAMLCSRSPWWVALCQCLVFSYFDLGL